MRGYHGLRQTPLPSFTASTCGGPCTGSFLTRWTGPVAFAVQQVTEDANAGAAFRQEAAPRGLGLGVVVQVRAPGANGVTGLEVGGPVEARQLLAARRTELAPAARDVRAFGVGHQITRLLARRRRCSAMSLGTQGSG